MSEVSTTETVLRPTPGEGLLARAGDLVLLCGTAEQARSEELLAVLERVAAERGDGRRFVRRVAGAVFAMETPPALVAYGPTAEGQALLVRGAATAVARTAEGDVRLEGADAVTWNDRVLHGSSAITASLGANPMGAVSTAVRLDDGVVPAGGFALTEDDSDDPVAALPETPADEGPGRSQAPPEAGDRSPSGFRPLGRAPVDLPAESETAREDAARHQARHAAPAAEPLQPPEPAPAPESPPAPEPSPAPGPPPAPEPPAAAEAQPSQAQVGPHTMTDAEEEDDDPAQAQGAPEVLGIYCKNEHFNHPEARFCAVCGISMVQLTHVPKPGKRPPLGVLVLDDGQTFRLDTTYIIGREPERNQDVLRGHATPVLINDPDALVSRSHTMVTLDGWNVQVVDLESANGTHILAPGATGWLRLQPNQRQTIVPGTRIAIGRRGFLYESHRKY